MRLLRPARGWLVVGVAALAAACSSGDASVPEAVEGDEHIPCALGGADAFAKSCAVEQVKQDGTLYLVVRHPDGGFRRFEVLTDGRGVALADGADEAVLSLADGGLEVTVGKDRYRFPAKQKTDATKP